MSKKHIFFVRADNDLDHLVPIMYYLLSKNREVLMIHKNHIKSLDEDFRAIFLKEFKNFSCINLLDTFSPKKDFIYRNFLKYIYWYLIKIYGRINNIYFAKLLRFFVSKVSNSLLKLSTSIENAIIPIKLKELIDVRNAASINFDLNNQAFTSKYVRIFSEMGIPVIVLQHSVPHINSFQFGPRIHIKKKKIENSTHLNEFSFIIAPNSLIENRYARTGVIRSKINVLGSPRFSYEWSKKLREIHKYEKKIFSTSKKKVLLIASKLGGHIFKSDIFSLIRAILNDDRFELVIKPHTRVGFSGFPIDIANNCYMAANEPTISLVEEADLILFWSTSFIYDPLVLGKPMYFIKYVYSLPFDFDGLISCWNINHRDDFSRMMNNFAENNPAYQKFLQSYEEERQICARKIVYADSENIEDNFIKFYTNIENANN